MNATENPYVVGALCGVALTLAALIIVQEWKRSSHDPVSTPIPTILADYNKAISTL